MTSTQETIHLVTCSCPACTGGQSLASHDNVTTTGASVGTTMNVQNAAANLVVPGTEAGYVQALLGTNAIKWNDAGSGVPTLGTAANVNYSFGSVSFANPFHYGSGAAFDAARTAAAMDAMNMYSSVANITFTATSAAVAKLGFHTYDLPAGVGGQAATSTYTTGSIYTSEVTIDTTGAGSTFTAGGYGYVSVIHELGHAIGLKHPGNYNAGGGGATGPFLSNFGLTDNHDVTVMSYYAGTYTPSYSNAGNASTPMLYDIAAVQALYGVNHSYHSGNDTLLVNTTSGMFTRWDGAGNDTLSSTAFTGDVTLDLREGAAYVSHVGNSHSWNAFGANIENATAGNGNDVLYGNALDNILNGGTGNDTLLGGTGNDTLLGSTGSDTFNFSGSGDGHDVISDSDSQGVIVIDSKSLTGTALNLGSGNYSLNISGTDFDLNLDGSTLHVSKHGGNTLVDVLNFINGGFGLTLNGAIITHTIIGTTRADNLTGTAGDDVIDGAIGNDTLSGGISGGDSVSGGAGDDRITLLGASSTGLGGDGNDSILASGADTTLDGGTGNDTITASGSGDSITGGDGIDKITTSGATTFMDGGTGNDILMSSGANNTINGGDGNDILSSTGANASIAGGAGTDKITASGTGSNINGDTGNDTISLTITATNTTIEGGADNDAITSAAAGGNLSGGAGLDKITATGADTALYGDAGTDVLSSSGDRSTLDGGDDNDSITSTGASSHLAGGGGVDKITSSGVTSIITGDAGNDTIISTGTNATVDGGNDNDTITISGLGSHADGGAGLDKLTSSAANAIINGGDDNDAILSTAVGATIDGGNGDDNITSNGAGSSISGGAGIDKISVAAINNYVDGGNDNDIITFSSASAGATVHGGTGDDSIKISITTGTAYVYGDAGNDVILSSTARVAMHFDGGANNDSIVAGLGADTITGGTGLDTITGGTGGDTIVLGSDGEADRVIFATKTDGALAGQVTGYDLITGFDSGIDQIAIGTTLKTAWDDIGRANGSFTFTTNGPANFSTVNEGWIVTGLHDADLTQAGLTTLTAALNSHEIIAARGADGLIAVQGDTMTAVFSYLEASNINNIQASELQLLGVVDAHLTSADILFV